MFRASIYSLSFDDNTIIENNNLALSKQPFKTKQYYILSQINIYQRCNILKVT